MPHDPTIEDLHIQEPEREDETLEWLLWYIDEMCYRNGIVEWEGVVSDWTTRPYQPYIVATLSDGQRWGIPDPTGRALTIVGALQDGLRCLCEPKPITIPRYELAAGHALDLLAAQRDVHRTADVNAEVETRGCNVALTGTVEPTIGSHEWEEKVRASMDRLAETFAEFESMRQQGAEKVARAIGESLRKQKAARQMSHEWKRLCNHPHLRRPSTDPVTTGKRNLARALTEAQYRAGGHPSGHPENERQVEHAMEWLEGQVRIWVQWLGGARTEADR